MIRKIGNIFSQKIIICIQEHSQIYLTNTLFSSQILPNSGLKEQSKIYLEEYPTIKGLNLSHPDIKITLDGKEQTLRYQMAACAGINKCPESSCNYIVPIKEHLP